MQLVRHDSSVGELVHLTVCPYRGPGSILRHHWEERGDGRRQVVTSPLRGYGEYEAIQPLLFSDIRDGQKWSWVLKKVRQIFCCNSSEQLFYFWLVV